MILKYLDFPPQEGPGLVHLSRPHMCPGSPCTGGSNLVTTISRAVVGGGGATANSTWATFYAAPPVVMAVVGVSLKYDEFARRVTASLGKVCEEPVTCAIIDQFGFLVYHPSWTDNMTLPRNEYLARVPSGIREQAVWSHITEEFPMLSEDFIGRGLLRKMTSQGGVNPSSDGMYYKVEGALIDRSSKRFLEGTSTQYWRNQFNSIRFDIANLHDKKA